MTDASLEQIARARLGRVATGVPFGAAVLLLAVSAAAQDGPPRTANNVVYAELLGPAPPYSIDYERVWQSTSARLGFSYFATSEATYVAFPITISYLGIGSLKNMLELGFGGTIIYMGGVVSDLGNTTCGDLGGCLGSFALAPVGNVADQKGRPGFTGLGTVIVGYRFQPPGGGFFLKAGISPLLTGNQLWFPWPYVGLGATF